MSSTLVVQPRHVPLTMTEQGVWRVSGTRIPLERVIESYQAGLTPEEIVDCFDTLNLADVYIVIGYYLDHKEEVEQYLREAEAKAEEIRAMVEARQPSRPGFKEELLRRKALRENNKDAETGP